VLECVVNVSEGRDRAVLAALADAAEGALLDLHADADHHRCVLTLVGEEAVRRVAEVALARIDLSRHAGVHPRLGAVDVVPFVALDGRAGADAVSARDRFAAWWAQRGVPCFRYGPDRPLPEVRRRAFGDLLPDLGPSSPHPTAGATAVGVRGVLVAYNVWLTGPGAVEVARSVARQIRGPALRALGLEVAGGAQVSMNLVVPGELGPAAAHDLVAGALAATPAVTVARAELVGLLPEDVLHQVPAHRWGELDLDAGRTIEARLDRLGARR
jgi:glutamate formiminotransferase / 5-formyltetrahydrofolate cyclo-ligase